MASGDLDSFAYNSCDTNNLININLGVPSEETHGCNNTNDKQFTTRCYWFIDLPTTLMVNSSQLVVIDLLIYQQH